MDAKRSVEARALNSRVWERLEAWVQTRPHGGLSVLELGAGTGSMLRKFLDTGIMNGGYYTAVDRSAENLQRARESVMQWAADHEISINNQTPLEISLVQGAKKTRLEFISTDIFHFLEEELTDQKWDMIIAHAILDLLDARAVLPPMLDRLDRDGAFYFPITFDGVTIFEPVIDPDFDEEIIRCYHESMDSRRVAGKPSGESRTGRRLFGYIEAAGGQVVEAGSSDWIIYPQGGSYSQDEVVLLKFIIQTMNSALTGHPELDANQLSDWMTRRMDQISSAELVYIAHQIDFFGLR